MLEVERLTARLDELPLTDAQPRCRRKDPRGHQCELRDGHAGEHQRQPAVLTWPEWLGGDATEGKGQVLECLECGDPRTQDRLNPIDWSVGAGLCCCSAEVHVTRHELDDMRMERDAAREVCLRLLNEHVVPTSDHPWLVAAAEAGQVPDAVAVLLLRGRDGDANQP